MFTRWGLEKKKEFEGEEQGELRGPSGKKNRDSRWGGRKSESIEHGPEPIPSVLSIVEREKISAERGEPGSLPA